MGSLLDFVPFFQVILQTNKLTNNQMDGGENTCSSAEVITHKF